MTDIAEAKRGPGRPRKEAEPLDALRAAADTFAAALVALPPADGQRLNVYLNGNHEITHRDALRMAQAVIDSVHGVNTTRS